ncbi:MAG: response regulator [Haloferacaceae archaeon]
MTRIDRPTILVVDDEETVAEVYAAWLSDRYDVRTATDGEEALEEMDTAVDVVLLDRRMPRLSGEEVLEHIREEGYGASVAMVTAVDPDFDVVEMPFDEYLTKPVSREELSETVQKLVTLASFDEAVRDEFALARKRAALESEKPRSELEDNPEYEALTARHENAKDAVEETVDEMDDQLFRAALSDLPGGDEE